VLIPVTLQGISLSNSSEKKELFRQPAIPWPGQSALQKGAGCPTATPPVCSGGDDYFPQRSPKKSLSSAIGRRTLGFRGFIGQISAGGEDKWRAS